MPGNGVRELKQATRGREKWRKVCIHIAKVACRYDV